jgi:transcriptional regulator with GAF, ATPase, and Fis domain/tetratricopeptide (TPR) repeat protein
MSTEVLSLWGRASVDALTGRDAELSMLLRELDDAKAAQRARFVFLKGPAGVGKSHLFGLIRASAARRGAQVFEGGSGRDARRTFGLFAPMVQELVQHLGQNGVPAARLAELARLVGPLTKATAAQVMENRRVELYDAVCELFALAGRGAPVFLFPDLDAADRASLELFRYLAAVATLPGARGGGLFIASLRDDGALPEPLPEVLAKVPARSLPLAGLDLDGIRAYLTRGDVAQRLLEATAGNPEALQRLLDRTQAPAVDLFVKRAERLAPEARAVLDLLSTCGDALALSTLEAALGTENVAQQLDALVQGRYLTARVLDGQPVYRFWREADRQAWVEAMAVSRKEAAQREVARALAAKGEVISAASLLFSLGPTAEALELSVRAGDELSARGAHEDAAEFYARALTGLRGPQRARVLERTAQVLAGQGALRRATRALLESNRLASSPQKVLLAARHLLRAGRSKLVEVLLPSALAHPSTRFEAEEVRAEVMLRRGNPQKAIELSKAALSEPGVGPTAAIGLRNLWGRALLARNEAREAAELFALNASVAEEAGLKEAAALAALNRGVAAQKLNDRETAIACYRAAEAHPVSRYGALANLGALYYEAGDFELSLDCQSRALQLVARHLGPKETAHVASNLARLHHFLGDFERALELSEHTLALSQQVGDGYLEGSALLNLGSIALDKKDYSEALRCLEGARARLESIGNDGFAALAAALKARAHLMMGERAQAEGELQRRCVERGVASLPAAAVEVELTRGELSLQLSDLHGAGRAAARAKDALLASPDLEGPFRVYLLMARLRAAAGDVGAHGELNRAFRMLEELLQRVPPVRRTAFLSVPRRAELLAAVEPELKLPRSVAVASVVPEKKLGLIGRSAALQRIVKQLEPIGRSNTTVLIRGESGTGKELLADALHELSPRRGMPLVKVNCAAMVEELLLSELFGHEKGAFTGAIRERKGRFELADGGTLFLDEIGDISAKCQVALLRVLQERELERVGGTKTIKVDVRVICATNRDLEALISVGRFRADLYYRLKGVMLELPSLRERTEDLPLLCAHFLERVARERQEPVKRLSEASLKLLSKHAWPGNVRELENVLSAAAIFAEGDLIEPDAFSHVAELRALSTAAAMPAVPAAAVLPVRPIGEPLPRPGAGSLPPPAVTMTVPPDGNIDYFELARTRGISLKELRHEVEMQCIRRALSEAGGNISEAARLLKMKRSRLSQIVNAEGELKEVARGDEE